MSKNKIMKDLKKMGLIPTKKQSEDMKVVGMILVFILLTGLAMYGAWKYPIPHHYYENMNMPAQHYSNVAYTEECECGNDPSCRPLWWWHDQKQVEEKYRYYV